MKPLKSLLLGGPVSLKQMASDEVAEVKEFWYERFELRDRRLATAEGEDKKHGKLEKQGET